MSASDGHAMWPQDSFVLLTVIIALVFAAVGMSTPLITLYLEALGADYQQIALILGTTAVVSLVSSYAWGRLSDLLQRRRPLIAGGLAGLAVAYFLLSRITSPGWAWIVRLGEAGSMAAYSTASLALVGDVLAARGGRGQRMGTYRGIGSLAFAAGALVGGTLAERASLAHTFALCALLYFGAALLGLLLHEAGSVPGRQFSPAPVAEANPGADLADQGHARSGVPARRLELPPLFLAGVALWTLAWYAQASLWPNYMASLGYNKVLISGLWGLAALIEAPAMRLSGQLADLAGREALLTAGGFGAVLVVLGYALLGRMAPLLVGLQVLRGLVFGGYTASAMTYAVEAAGESARGRGSGEFNTAEAVGRLVGLFLAGSLAQSSGFVAMFGACAAAAFLGGLCFWVLRFRHDRSSGGYLR